MAPAGLQTDVLVIGGGIAGLWTLARLRAAGFNAWLVENRALGGIQSIASQGIIHGGSKYALGGVLGDSAKAIGDMPQIWRDCLAGKGELDLSAVKVLTQHQLLWSTHDMVSRVAGFFAGKLMQSRMQPLPQQEYPAPFDDAAFDGALYQLNEPVLDTHSVMAALQVRLQDYCLLGEVSLNARNPVELVCSHEDQQLQITTQCLVLSAGGGNEALLQQLNRDVPKMQRRPVHMVMLKGPLSPVYAHCLSGSATPRVTITSKVSDDGDMVWYIGGQVSETGVERDRDAQIRFCQQELHELLPWLDFSGMQWATVRLDRCEVATPGGKRPDSSFVQLDEKVITAWPTKLAFAPRLAGQVMEMLQPTLTPAREPASRPDWPSPPLAQHPWQQDIPWS
ncbi:MAG: FAD-dependent oxidoreductase [Chromatiales bacterium]|jgi:glycerol-3-phosphate dehydrogenase